MKVHKAQVCLFCDEIFNNDEQFCPSCAEKNTIYLRTYFKPLSSQIIREVKDGKEILNPLSMVGKIKPTNSGNAPAISYVDSQLLKQLFNSTPAHKQRRFAPDHYSEPPATGLGKGDNPSGKPMEREGRFICWGRRIDASIALFRDALCRIFREGTFLSRKEYYCGHENTCILSTDIANTGGGIK